MASFRAREGSSRLYCKNAMGLPGPVSWWSFRSSTIQPSVAPTSILAEISATKPVAVST